MSADDFRTVRSAARQELKHSRRELSENRALVARLQWARTKGESPKEIRRVEDALTAGTDLLVSHRMETRTRRRTEVFNTPSHAFIARRGSAIGERAPIA